MAHHVKTPPRHTFSGQMITTLVSTLVATSIPNYEMTEIPDVSTATQKYHYTCPGINQFFTAAVFWGTVGPKKIFDSGGMYNWLLISFPLGVVVPLVAYLLRKKFPRQS
ncbi:OPT oligopeptide transporter protein-domain-containing protein [Clohesyomyces aquaticus]|uniref:OPT oligopeptide transporter protein-domain-containing protein n=1 Tax=Clohesyomyces aquaticus TaxID=1231657 RepID=A0A1Y1YPR0_9PLEO|nr:OPT oligopeptide transporter protein-domain-containing protein [Clohesyomyces aquaticus]